MLFASLVIERLQLTWDRVPYTFSVWLQNAGAVAAFAIVLVLLARLAQKELREMDFWSLPPRLRPILTVFKYFLIASAVGYLAVALIWVGARLGFRGLYPYLPRANIAMPFQLGDWLLIVSGTLALFVVVFPIAYDLIARVSWGRIWAITRLSWKEAIRGRIIWVFGAMSLIFLFAEWFVPYKAEDQVRTYVRVVYWSMTPLFLLTAGLLGAFSIPNDVKNNSIHTIVTKPVEKIEIVLGRFFGYASLLTVGLFTVAGLSLIYVVRGVNDEAKKESYKARVPVYGYLHYAGTEKGESVGREFERRRYIRGLNKRQRDPLKQYAIWDFPVIPATVIERGQPLIFEFDFDVFRLSKGAEGEGVFCTFTFVDVSKFASPDPNRQAQELDAKISQMNQERERLREAATKRLLAEGAGKPPEQVQAQIDQEKQNIDLEMVKEYGIYHPQYATEVSDYHTGVLLVPAAEFKAIAGDGQMRPLEGGGFVPPLRVFVSMVISNESQMLGVAQPDFYLLAYENWFWLNFLKGVVGMWCTHMLVLGVVIACSTYLTGVISFILGMILYTAGLFTDYLIEVAERRVSGGGPTEAFMRMSRKLPIAAQIDDSPTAGVAQIIDNAFSWWVGKTLSLIPDINRHDLHQYVANGFDIAWIDLLLVDNVLPMIFYLLPWFFLAYYLMKYREIANPR